jgi:glycogen(starch) synthase
MQRRGHEFAVITSHAQIELPDREEYAGIPIYRFPLRAALTDRNPSQWLTARRRVMELKQTFAPELVHLFALGPGALFHLQTPLAQPTPLLVTLHGEVLRGGADGGDTVLEKVLGSADWVTCVSNAVLDKARELAPQITGHSSLNYIGVEPPPVPPAPLPFTRPLLLCLGRLVPIKGFDLALTAFATVAPQFPQAHLVIAGDGPMRTVLEHQARELGLAERVKFTGWFDANHVPELINTSTVVLMPSRREGLPQVSLQAAQMARPVVAARVGGLPEVVVDGETGIVIAPEDSAALAEAIAFLIEHPERAVQMGQAARRRVESHFGWTRYLDEVEVLYRQLAVQN